MIFIRLSADGTGSREGKTIKKRGGRGTDTKDGRRGGRPGPGGETAAGKPWKESRPFYHTAAWKRLRQAALNRDGGMCQDCMDRVRAGYGIRPRRAELVHHIIPVEERPDLALDINNLRSLCSWCHAREHPEKGWKTAKPRKAGGKMMVVKV